MTKGKKKSILRSSANTGDPAHITPEEKEAIETQVSKDEESRNHVSMEVMEKVVSLIEDQFNLKGKDFNITSFKDSSTKCVVSVSNGDFDMTITIRDRDKYGLS